MGEIDCHVWRDDHDGVLISANAGLELAELFVLGGEGSDKYDLVRTRIQAWGRHVPTLYRRMASGLALIQHQCGGCGATSSREAAAYIWRPMVFDPDYQMLVPPDPDFIGGAVIGVYCIGEKIDQRDIDHALASAKRSFRSARTRADEAVQ